jgi:hypothetical protein
MFFLHLSFIEVLSYIKRYRKNKVNYGLSPSPLPQLNLSRYAIICTVVPLPLVYMFVPTRYFLFPFAFKLIIFSLPSFKTTFLPIHFPFGGGGTLQYPSPKITIYVKGQWHNCIGKGANSDLAPPPLKYFVDPKL